MATRKCYSLNNETVLDVLNEKARTSDASGFIEESILFYLKYKDIIEQVTDLKNVLNYNSQKSSALNIDVNDKKKSRLKNMLK